MRTLTIRSALLQGVALLASVVAPALASADQLLAQEHADTSVSAYGGHVVWSSWDEQTHRYRLTEYSGGGVHVLPVRGRVVPFDADVGLGARGNPVVLYSRCLQETEPNAIENGTFADYSAARGCHVFRYEFRSRRERKLRLPGPPGRSDFLPSQWRDRLAFVRVYGRRHGRAGRLPHIEATRSGRAGGLVQVRAGPRGRYDGPEGGPGPVGLDLRKDRLAFVWDAVVPRCHPQEEEFEVTLSQVWWATLGGSRRLVEEGCAGNETNYFFSPSFTTSNRLFYFQRRNLSDAEAPHFRAFRLGSASISDAQAPEFTEAVARDASGVYYSRWAVGGIVSIYRSSPLDMQPARPSRR